MLGRKHHTGMRDSNRNRNSNGATSTNKDSTPPTSAKFVDVGDSRQKSHDYSSANRGAVSGGRGATKPTERG